MLDRPENRTEAEESDENGLLLEEVKITLNEGNHFNSSQLTITPLSHVQLIELIKDFNTYTNFATCAGRTTIPFALISATLLGICIYIFSLNTENRGLVFPMGVFGILTLMSLTSACVYYSDAGNSLFIDFINTPSNYEAKKTKALRFIKEYNVTIKDNPDTFEILNGLNKVKSIIENYEGKIHRRKSAIKNSLTPLLFNSLKPGTSGHAICNEIFEYAGLLKPGNVK